MLRHRLALTARCAAFGALLGACSPAPVGASRAVSTSSSPRPDASSSTGSTAGVAAGLAIGPDAATTDVSSLVGKPAPQWDLPTWLNGPPRTLGDLRGKVVLVRWFMSSECPYCNATAPALVAFDEAYAERGLAVVGMYHHKSDAPLVLDDVRALVKDHYRFRFPVAIDDDWKTLKSWWLTDHPKSWTSVSFLVDRAGVVRHAHLGGEYPPDSDDHRQIRAWIEELLAEPAEPAEHRLAPER